MKTKLVTIPSIKDPIKASPGFAKKELATYKLDIMGLCNFGCVYCSSNEGNYLRINRERFAQLTQEQLGETLLPSTSPELSFKWGDFEERLDAQLAKKPRAFFPQDRWGDGHTLVFSQLTDAFSPQAVADGLTMRTLEKVIAHTGFRIRVLTKSAIVGTKKWIDFFAKHRDCFVVGLSIGTLDDVWARRIEIGTSSPSARIRATHRLQDAGVPTFGMLCPVFPHALERGDVRRIVEAIRPDRCETVWAEPYNDRNNWRAIAERADDYERSWLTDVFGHGNKDAWSAYASGLYQHIVVSLARHDSGDQSAKLRYLLYEGDVSAKDVPVFRDGPGVLLQGPKGHDKSDPSTLGFSKHPMFRFIEQKRQTAAT